MYVCMYVCMYVYVWYTYYYVDCTSTLPFILNPYVVRLQSIVLTLESLNTEVEDAMCRFLKSLSDAIIITPDMMRRVCISFDDDDAAS